MDAQEGTQHHLEDEAHIGAWGDHLKEALLIMCLDIAKVA